MTITLYSAPLSSATPVLNALLELRIPHELVQLDLSDGEQCKPEFLALNPNGKVPTLVVDGTPMFEALAIMQWLGDRFGLEHGLWPSAEAPERLQALSWSTWAYVTFVSQMSRFIYATSERFPQELHHAGHAEDASKELQKLLGVLDGRLANSDYLLGNDFGLVDLIVACCVTYGTFCGVSVEAHAHVRAWLARFHARPAYQKRWLPPAG